MAISVEQNIQPLVEKEYLQEFGVRSYLDLWCQANDKNLRPTYLSRTEWESQVADSGMLVQEGEAVNLYLPTDLKLWEMMGVVTAIDDFTFQGTEKAGSERLRLKEAIGIYRQTASYLKERITEAGWDQLEADGEEEGIDLATRQAAVLAKQLALEFYQFGRSLLRRNRVIARYEDIPVLTMSNEEKLQIEQKLMGVDFVRKRYWRLQDRVGGEPSESRVEGARQYYFELFFKAIGRDFFAQLDFSNLEAQDPQELDLAWQEYVAIFLGIDEGELEAWEVKEKRALTEKFLFHQPWERSSPSLSLQFSVALGLEGLFSLPKAELEEAILRRGRHQLLTLLTQQPGSEPDPIADEEYAEMIEESGSALGDKREQIATKVDLAKLKKELNDLREAGAPVKKIVKKELAIVNLIQQELTEVPYLENSSSPVQIREQQQINCVGAVLISGLLFDEVGIKYLAGEVHEHAVNFVVTSDGQIHFRDMRVPDNNQVLSEKQLGSVGLWKVREFINRPESRALNLICDPEWYQQIALSEKPLHPHLLLFQPGVGIQSLLENNLAFEVQETTKVEDSGEALSKMIESLLLKVPNDQYMLMKLVEVYLDKGDYLDATLTLFRIEQLTPEKSEVFRAWSILFQYMGRDDLALEAARKAIILAPKDQYAWQELLDSIKLTGDFARLEEGYLQARLHSDYLYFSKKLAMRYEAEGLLDQMSQIYEELLTKYPDDQDLWTEYYQKRVEYFSHDEQNFRLLCASLWEQGETEAVHHYVREAIKENPSAPWAQDMLTEYYEVTATPFDDEYQQLMAGKADFDIPQET